MLIVLALHGLYIGMVKLYPNKYILVHFILRMQKNVYSNNITTHIPINKDPNNNSRDSQQIIYTFIFVYLFILEYL